MQHAIKTGKIASSNLAGSNLLLLHVLRLLLSPKGAMVELETLSSSSCCKILVVEVVIFTPNLRAVCSSIDSLESKEALQVPIEQADKLSI